MLRRYERFAETFDGMARSEIKVWRDFNQYWLDVCAGKGHDQSAVPFPLHIVRYEDLLLRREETVRALCHFLCEESGHGEGVQGGDALSPAAANHPTAVHWGS